MKDTIKNSIHHIMRRNILVNNFLNRRQISAFYFLFFSAASEIANKADRNLSNLTAEGEAKLNSFDNDFTIIYPNGGSKSSPANVTKNSRYVESNPFPGYRVYCEAEFLYNNEWGKLDFITTVYGSSTNYAEGASVGQLNDNNIILIIATHGLLITQSSASAGSVSGNLWGITTAVSLTSAPCRVKVWKIGKIQN